MRRDAIRAYSMFFGLLAVILMSISLIAYLKLIAARIVINSFLVWIAMVMLLVFLLILIVRYFVLIWFSYLDHMEGSVEEESDFTPPVTIIVPAYNEGLMISDSIRSLLELDYPNYEIIVVDDGSEDDTYERARHWEGVHDGVRVRVLTKRNTGKALSLNFGIQHAWSPFILCMDGDSKLTKDTIRKGVRHFQEPSVVAVAGNVKIINRKGVFAKLQALEYIEGLNLVRRAQGFYRVVNIIPGPLGIFRRETLLDAGGYSNDTYAEDCDLTLKILTRGWKIRYEPEAIAYTEAPIRLTDILKQRYRWTRGILQSLRKHSVIIRSPIRHFAEGPILWYMIFEALIWPGMNILSNLFLIFLSVWYGLTPLILWWWVQLTLLDFIVALHCVAMEKEDLRLVFYALYYRLFYILIIDVCKVFATFEELLGVKMGWGKLVRTGTE